MPPRVIRKKTVYENPFCRFEEWVVEQNGKEFFYGMREYARGAAIVFALTPTGEVVMVREFFLSRGMYEYGLPAGMIDDSEEPLESAKRELLEETGYHAKTWTDLGHMLMSKYMTGDYYFFLAEDVVKSQEQNLEPSEDLSVELFPVEKVLEMAKKNEIYDTPRLLCAYKALAHLKKL